MQPNVAGGVELPEILQIVPMHGADQRMVEREQGESGVIFCEGSDWW